MSEGVYGKGMDNQDELVYLIMSHVNKLWD